MASTEPSAALGLLPQTATFSGRRCRRMTSSPSSPLVDVKCPQPARAITLTSHSLEACFRVQRSLSSGQDWISSRGGAQDPRSRATSRSRAGVGASNHMAPFEHHMFAAHPAPHTHPAPRCRAADGDRPPSILLAFSAARSRLARRVAARRACMFWPRAAVSGQKVLQWASPGVWCSLFSKDRPSRPLLLQRTLKTGIPEIAIDL